MEAPAPDHHHHHHHHHHPAAAMSLFSWPPAAAADPPPNLPPAASIGLPPGFRFHPTDEELVSFYLANKIRNPNFTACAIADADLNKLEPWELPGM
jgi:hypothetical protein